MIDFHSHILPNIDDGSKSVEETFELLQEAKKAGFEAIISTSHYMEGYYEAKVSTRKVWIEALSEGLAKKNIDLKLYLGSEIYITEDIIDLIKRNNASSINNSRYILFEFPLNTKPMNIYDVIYGMQEANYMPVLAHPERYLFVQKEPQLVYELIQKGVLIQSNYGSIIGKYGEKAKIIITKLLQNNMVHFLGSDVHRKDSIYLKIPEILDELKNIIDEEKIEEITSINPKLVLENKNIEIDEPTPFKLSFKEKMFINFK